MVTATRKIIETHTQPWWKRILMRHHLFFRLIQVDSISSMRVRDLDNTIARLEANYFYLQQIDYPKHAKLIREHLLNATQHLIETLYRMRERQIYESDLRFDIAKVDYDLLQNELFTQGLFSE